MKRALLTLLLLTLMQQSGASQALGQTGLHSPAPERLVVGVVSDPPYLIKGRDGQWSGFAMDVWRHVADELKVAYEIREMPFSELLDSLRENRIDVAIDGFFLLAERGKFMDFAVPLGSTRLAVATLPDKLDHPWIAALKIFFSWGIMKIIILLLSILLALGIMLWYVERSHNPEHFGGGLLHGIGSGIYWVGSTLASGVCFGISLKTLGARILGLVWMLSCTLMFSALTASLTTSLTASRNMANAVSDETLRHMSIAGIKGSAEAGVLKEIGCDSRTLYDSEEDALNAVLNRQVDGYLYDEITLRYYSDKGHKGRIAVYPTNTRRFSFAYGLPKDSPWRTRINVALMNLMEKPDWDFLFKRYGIGSNSDGMSTALPVNKIR